MTFIFYYDSITNYWYALNATSHVVNNPIRVIGYKQDLYSQGDYAVVQIDGALKGVEFPASVNVTKLRFNWIRDTAKQAPEVGLYLPEIYVEFEH